MRHWMGKSLLALAVTAASLTRAQELAESKTAPATPVGLAGDSRRILFAGAEAFDAESITSALAADLMFQAAARPSGDRNALIDTCQERIKAGYLRAGYLVRLLHFLMV